MSSQGPSDLDDLPDWGAPRPSAPVEERDEAVETSPPPLGPPLAEESSTRRDGPPEARKDTLGSAQTPVGDDRSVGDEFGEFIHGGDDAAPPLDTEPADDIDRRAARTGGSPERQREDAGQAERAIALDAGEVEPAAPTDSPPSEQPVHHVGGLGNGRPSPVRLICWRKSRSIIAHGTYR